MISSALAATLSRRDVHYGWVVAAVTFLTMLVTAGAMGAPGVFMVPLQKEFGWNAADISSALALRFALFGLMGPFAAAFMNHFGVRRVMVVALTVVISGLLLSIGMNQLWQLVMLWGVVVGLGTGLTAMVLGATVATRWFSTRRGLVVGMLSASSATGQLVFLPALASLTESHGWRFALAFVCCALGLALVVVALLMRNRPADLGLMAYGAKEAAPVATRQSLGQMLLSPVRILREVSGSRAFWVLFATFFICGASTNGLIQTHFISLCGDYGLAPVMAASVLATMGIFDFFGTIG
ncbi:MAG TPA: MFS transporter, partial [Burkholderiales bacterium]|nr:MFS transporter [Burkholderiales bacterium]